MDWIMRRATGSSCTMSDMASCRLFEFSPSQTLRWEALAIFPIGLFSFIEVIKAKVCSQIQQKKTKSVYEFSKAGAVLFCWIRYLRVQILLI